MSKSRWGGFFKGRKRYTNWWEELRTPDAATESVSAPASPIEFDYTTAQGIWNLNSTVQFYKGNVAAEGGGGGGGGATIAFEGYATGSAGNGSGYTLNLSSLTGGGTAAAGDLAILILGVAGYNSSVTDQQVSSSGWTLLQGRLWADSLRNSVARVYYKVLGAGETSVSVANASGGTTSYISSSGAVLVFSGASTATSSNTGTNNNSRSPSLSGYTGLTAGNFIIDWGVTGGSMKSGSYSSANYDTVGSIFSNDTADVITGFGVAEATTSTFTGTLTASDGGNCVYGQIVIS
jgi:hypothetical protein